MEVLLVDSRETAVPAALERLGRPFRVERLESADYAFGRRWAIERKTVRDLHLSAWSGRLWRQLLVLRRSGPRPYLLVEGRSLGGGPLPVAAVHSLLLAVVDLGVALIRSDDPTDSAAWIDALVRRAHPARARTTFVLRRARVTGTHPAETALVSADGVSFVTARALLARFGSLAAVSAASEADLLAVPGVGHARARAILRLLHQNPC
jgi:ERCC4-type nuclease